MRPRGEPGPLSRLAQGLRWLISPGESLGSRTLNAGVWAGALSLSTRLLRTIRTIILARLLAPDDFGLMGFAVLALTLIQVLTRTGFGSALIQREGDIRHHLNTAWTTAVVRGLVLGLVLFIGAPAVGQFFDSEEAVALVRALAVMPLLGGLNNVGVVYFDKELLFRERFLFRSFPRIVELLASVAFAIWLRNVWALVLGQITAEVASVIASYVAHSFRPRLQIVGERFRELFSFGVWTALSGMLVYLMNNLDDIAVGRLLSPGDLGLYQMAFTITGLVAVEINAVINQVTFPAFSKLQSRPKALREAYLQTIQLVGFVAIPVTMGLWFVGPTAVEFLLGDKWLALLPAFGPLLIWGFVRAIGGTAEPLFKSIGSPSTNTAVYAAATVSLAALIFPLTERWGIAGAAWATVAATVAFMVHIGIAGQRLHIEWGKLFRAIAIPTVCSAVMLGVLLTIAAVLPGDTGPALLIWAPLVGGGVYAVGIYVARRTLSYKPLRFLSEHGGGAGN